MDAEIEQIQWWLNYLNGEKVRLEFEQAQKKADREADLDL